jgi:hypothetical protein
MSSTYFKYADDALRTSQATWARAVEVLTETAKESLAQVQATRDAAVKANPTEGVVSYLNRALEVQSDASRMYVSLTTALGEQVVSHGDALATAVRDYLVTAQEVLRHQADKHYADFVEARDAAEQAVRKMASTATVGWPERPAAAANN